MLLSTNMNFSYSSNIRNFNELKNFPHLLDNTYNILKLTYLNYLIDYNMYDFFLNKYLIKI
jgi:hypothetical protein